VSKSNKPLVLVVTNNAIYIDGVISSDVYKGLKEALRYRPEDYYFRVQQFDKKQKQKGRKWTWDGWINLVCRDKRWCRCFLKKQGIHFATGLYSVAEKFFKDTGVPFKVLDKRKRYDKNLFLKMSKECEDRDYQTEFVDSCAAVERGVAKAATGAGKTFMSAKMVQQIGVAPFIVYVPSIDLLNQTKDEFEKFLRFKNGKKITVGMIGDGKFNPQDVTIMTIQTAIRACGGKYIKYDDEDKNKEDKTLDDKRKEILSTIMNAKGIICDEVQHWASETCQTISDYSVASRYRFGVSATPFRDKNDDILITSCFGRDIVGADVSASDLIRAGYLVKPNIYFVDIPGHDEGYTYQTIYKKYIVENQFRNDKIVSIAKNMMAANNVILILVRQITHGKMLASMMPESVFLYSKHSGKKRKEHLDRMRSGEPSITIATSIFDEGIDCKALNTLIQGGSGKSPTRALQRVGRTLRPFVYSDGRKKEFATVIDFMDNYKYLLNHSKKRRKMYSTESEFVIEDLDV